MRIEKYNASRLKEFLDSDIYREMPVVPVSLQRAESWLNNPRMKPEDILLYIGFEGDDMIAYRSILPDRHSEIRFGWLSGNWVLQDHRRMGLASKLFKEAYAVLHLNELDERFGLVMAEANGAGVPVIAYDRGSCKEVIADGKSGFIVNDVDEAVAAVKRIETIDPQACRKHVEDNFSIDCMVAGYEKAYEQIFKIQDAKSS